MTTPTVSVRGRCPACHCDGTLFVGSGGYVTCSWHVCPDPTAAGRSLQDCRVYWGSHGCHLPRGHSGPHSCRCCTCPDHERDHDELGCVATAPYYGALTRFYGDDAPSEEAS